MNVVGWFEIPVADMDRAKVFYEAVFETELNELPMGPDSQMFAFPWIDNAPQAAGALVKYEGSKPSPDGVRIYFTAPDFPGTLGRVKEHGGEVLVEEMSIGEHGFVGTFKDTEGNVISIHRRSDTA